MVGLFVEGTDPMVRLLYLAPQACVSSRSMVEIMKSLSTVRAQKEPCHSAVLRVLQNFVILLLVSKMILMVMLLLQFLKMMERTTFKLDSTSLVRYLTDVVKIYSWKLTLFQHSGCLDALATQNRYRFCSLKIVSCYRMNESKKTEDRTQSREKIVCKKKDEASVSRVRGSQDPLKLGIMC